jgi:hypothetical protein
MEFSQNKFNEHINYGQTIFNEILRIHDLLRKKPHDKKLLEDLKKQFLLAFNIDDIIREDVSGLNLEDISKKRLEKMIYEFEREVAFLCSMINLGVNFQNPIAIAAECYYQYLSELLTRTNTAKEMLQAIQNKVIELTTATKN